LDGLGDVGAGFGVYVLEAVVVECWVDFGEVEVGVFYICLGRDQVDFGVPGLIFVVVVYCGEVVYVFGGYVVDCVVDDVVGEYWFVVVGDVVDDYVGVVFFFFVCEFVDVVGEVDLVVLCCCEVQFRGWSDVVDDLEYRLVFVVDFGVVVVGVFEYYYGLWVVLVVFVG